MASQTPTILGTAVLSNGSLAVLAGNQTTVPTSSGFSSYYGFDQLQVAVLGDSTPYALNPTTGLSFPAGGSPDNRIGDPAGWGTIAALPGGGMAVETWGDANNQYYLQILSNTGAVIKAPFVVGNQQTKSGASYLEANPVGAVAAWSGGIVVAYSANDIQDGYFQRYTLDGTLVGSPVNFAHVTSSSINWSGSMAVDSLGDVIFGFSSNDVFTPGSYMEYNSSGTLIKSGTVASTQIAPVFAALPGGGFITVGYQASGSWNSKTGGYPSYNLVIQTVSASGTLSTVKTVANATASGLYPLSVKWIDTLANGTVEFQEYNGTTQADIFDPTTQTLTRNAVTLPALPFAVAPQSNGGNGVAGVAVNGNNDLVAEGLDTACFLPGTLIRTDRGEIAVEKLRTGDSVITLGGQQRRLCWIGQGRALATRGRRTAATPVIVRKGALSDNVPHNDLRITKGHSLYFDGMLIPVEFLVNHRSIHWDDRAQEVTVYHLELDTHDVLLANGAAAESYRDDGNRWLFSNANSGWNQPAKAPCAPVLTGGPLVDAIWRRLLDRSGPRSTVPLTDEPDLHLVVDSRRLDTARHDGEAYVFELPAPPDAVRMVSRAAVPQELGVARDSRSLGVAVRRVIVRQGPKFRVIEAGDPRLVQGFHTFETNNEFVWTDGDAVLPTALFAGFSGPVEIVLVVASTARYIEEGARQVAA
ncbi:MAG: Hint domain-containing protein [Rhodopila sp.]|nr:Hint domain-containing protein [Rhodopila sp.]